MGGKLWSDPEERYFWRVIIPQSVKRVIPTSLNQPPKSWPDLAAEMNTAMGNEARRRYTGTMLCKFITLQSCDGHYFSFFPLGVFVLNYRICSLAAHQPAHSFAQQLLVPTCPGLSCMLMVLFQLSITFRTSIWSEFRPTLADMCASS